MKVIHVVAWSSGRKSPNDACSKITNFKEYIVSLPLSVTNPAYGAFRTMIELAFPGEHRAMPQDDLDYLPEPAHEEMVRLLVVWALRNESFGIAALTDSRIHNVARALPITLQALETGTQSERVSYLENLRALSKDAIGVTAEDDAANSETSLRSTIADQVSRMALILQRPLISQVSALQAACRAMYENCLRTYPDGLEQFLAWSIMSLVSEFTDCSDPKSLDLVRALAIRLPTDLPDAALMTSTVNDIVPTLEQLGLPAGALAPSQTWSALQQELTLLARAVPPEKDHSAQYSTFLIGLAQRASILAGRCEPHSACWELVRRVCDLAAELKKAMTEIGPRGMVEAARNVCEAFSSLGFLSALQDEITGLIENQILQKNAAEALAAKSRAAALVGNHSREGFILIVPLFEVEGVAPPQDDDAANLFPIISVALAQPQTLAVLIVDRPAEDITIALHDGAQLQLADEFPVGPAETLAAVYSRLSYWSSEAASPFNDLDKSAELEIIADLRKALASDKQCSLCPEINEDAQQINVSGLDRVAAWLAKVLDQMLTACEPTPATSAVN